MEGNFCPGPVATGVCVESGLKKDPLFEPESLCFQLRVASCQRTSGPLEGLLQPMSSQHAQHRACRAGSRGLLPLQPLEGTDAESASILNGNIQTGEEGCGACPPSPPPPSYQGQQASWSPLSLQDLGGHPLLSPRSCG